MDKVDQIMSSEFIFRGKFLKIIRDQVKTFSGKIWFREYIHHPGAAMVIPELPNGKLLIIRQYRHALKRYFYEFPAGKIDSGENSKQTAIRELKEETGYDVQNIHLLTQIHPCIGYANEKIDIYFATDLSAGVASLDEGEDLTLQEMSFNELMELVQKGQVSDVKTQIGLFWYEKIKEKKWSF